GARGRGWEAARASTSPCPAAPAPAADERALMCANTGNVERAKLDARWPCAWEGERWSQTSGTIGSPHLAQSAKQNQLVRPHDQGGDPERRSWWSRGESNP